MVSIKSLNLQAGSQYPATQFIGADIIIDLAGATGTTSLTYTITGHYDKEDTTGFTLLASAARTANGAFRLTVHPAITPVANVAASAVLPVLFSIVQSGTTGGATAEIRARLLP